MKTSEIVSNGLLLTVVLCAMVTTALVVDRQLGLGLFEPEEDVGIKVDNWQRLGDRGQTFGADDAPVTLVVFSDYLCIHCRRFDPIARQAVEQYRGDLRVVVRHLPLRPESRDAALAAECAADQDRFAAFHQRLFEAPDSIGVAEWATFAARSGVPDTLALAECVRSEYPADRLRSDLMDARLLGATGTPTLVLNDKLIHGRIPSDVLAKLIERVR